MQQVPRLTNLPGRMNENDPMNQRITLNIRYDQPPEAWNAVMRVYESMPGWLGSSDFPRWYGTEEEAKYVWASVEPGGIVFEAQMDSEDWVRWITDLCNRLSAALRRPVHDAEA